MPSDGWLIRKKFSLKMQEVAINKYYRGIWPNYQITEIDKMSDDLAIQIDIGGGDKLLRDRGGCLIFIGQRFRKQSHWKKGYRDFTIREAEYARHLRAIRNRGFIPGYYVLGYANEDETDFTVLYVIDYRLWMEDVNKGILVMHFMRPRNEEQERFYYYPLEDIPDRYIIFRYPLNRERIKQMEMFA